MTHVLVVDDQQAVRTALVVLLDLHGIPCFEASSPEQALDIVRREDVGVVIQDMNFSKDTTSGTEGVELFRAIRALDPDLPVILITAWTSLESAVALVKEGAADYVAKPWDDQKLVLAIQNLIGLRQARLDTRRLERRDSLVREGLAQRYDLCGLVYESRAMHDVVSLAVHVAPSEVAVLISGPNGSGKEKLAEIVQANSRRADKPFVRVNAGGLPDQLLEAELFGAEPGAFTGATKLRVGRFESAHGGTLFLDELGNLSLAGQMKLLRVLQTGEFQRLGSNTTRRADVRLISATNADLRAEIAAGRFREDLYFRLNVIELNVPALANRHEDAVLLARHFLAHHSSQSSAGDKALRFSPEAIAALEQHDWPGNVRELENRVQRAVLVCDSGPILPGHLGLGERGPTTGPLAAVAPPSAVPASVPPSAPPAAAAAASPAPDSASRAAGPASNPLEEAERAVVESALARAAGVVSRAAAELGLSRQALYRRMDRLGIAIERRIR
ncbi:MAG TPA: sigma-54 dependent transcriptional regulator [Polyangiaceae bacterium]|nr:sigma-54 dependent transcriptional regulator [Polyangiaceae bacterium]